MQGSRQVAAPLPPFSLDTFARADARRGYLSRAVRTFERTLAVDSENVTAHYALALLYAELGDAARATTHRDAHRRYTADEQSRNRVIAEHRAAHPAANHAAPAVVIYDLQRKDGHAPVAPPQP